MAPMLTVTVRFFFFFWSLLSTSQIHNKCNTFRNGSGALQGTYRKTACSKSHVFWMCLIPSPCAEPQGIVCAITPTDASPKHAPPFLCVFCDSLVMVRRL